MRVFIVLSILVISNCLAAQEPEIKRERVFSGDALYGFMNGGAVLYLEYGFKKLTARDIIYKGEAFTLEIYEMPTAEDAFGIYSMHVHRCQQADSMGYINCFSPYQLQAIIDNLYISIVFPSGSALAQQLAGELIPKYAPTEQPPLPAIPVEIAPSPPFSAIVKYLRGPLSVSNVSRDLTALLKDIPYNGIWFKADAQTKTYQAAILFSTPEEQAKFTQTIPPSDILRSADAILLIQRKELENEPAKAGAFGF